MPSKFFAYLFIVLFVVMEGIRLPHRARVSRSRRAGQMTETRVAGLESALMSLSFVGMYALPFVYAFSDWLSFADFRLPDWVGWLGTVAFGLGVWLLWRAHRDLGRNWSPSLEISQEQKLVTSGVYRAIRHPIYAAVMLSVIAQALMLSNWLAGPAGLAVYLPIYLLRVPREEHMMLENFGEDYREYMSRTGRIFPRL